MATWTLTANYRLGWAGAGNWYNYTRQIPQGSYQVWASMSFGDVGADVLNGILSRVTSDPTKPNQTIETIGYFSGPTTGGWGANQLIPLRTADSDLTGNAAVVSLGGATPTTLRFEDASGDLDYFMLVPTTEAAAPVFSPPTLSNGSVTISWSGPGTLQEASNLTGNQTDWSDVPGNPPSPVTVSPASSARKFYRLRP